MEKTIEIQLHELREQIAVEIEAMNEVYCCAEVRDEAADIARGNR